MLYAFHETPDWTTELRERHRLFLDIIRLAKRLGVEFAFPTQTLHLASVPTGFAGAPAPGIVDSASEAGMRLGRSEAEALVAGSGSAEKGDPVDFSDPDGMGTGS